MYSIAGVCDRPTTSTRGLPHLGQSRFGCGCDCGCSLGLLSPIESYLCRNCEAIRCVGLIYVWSITYAELLQPKIARMCQDGTATHDFCNPVLVKFNLTTT